MIRICACGLGLSLAMASAAHAGAFTNGSFETNAYAGSGGFQTLTTGDTSITGWTVGGTSIDLIATYWQPADGTYSLDLSGLDAGTISQTFDTTAGDGYSVTFDLAGNPAGGNAVKQLLVSAGTASGSYSFDTTGHSTTSMGWTLETFFFVADSASTTLSFASLEANPYGPALDNVSVADIPEPFPAAILAMGLLGLAAARHRA